MKVEETPEYRQLLHEHSAALDELYALRIMAASESLIVKGHTEFASFPKSRRRFAEEQVNRLLQIARGRGLSVFHRDVDRIYTYARGNFEELTGRSPLLTRDMFAREVALRDEETGRK